MGCLVVSDSLQLHGWQIPLPLEFSRQEYWDVVPFSPPRDLPDPGVEPVVLKSPALAGGFFYHSCHLGSPIVWGILCKFIVTNSSNINIKFL